MASRPIPDANAARPQNAAGPISSTSRFVEAGGLNLHYLDYGTAGRTPMLCLHGGGAHAHWFDFIASGFTGDYHVRALDHRGHGDSEWSAGEVYGYDQFVSDLAQAIERLDLRDFVLVGHSMGGTIAVMYAAAHPGRVSRLVVIDSRLNMTGERIAAMHEVGSRQPRRYATRDEFVAGFRLRPGGTTATPEVIRHVAWNGCRQEADGTWRHKFDRAVYAGRLSVNALSCWSSIRIPALLVKGDRSPRITPEVYAQVKAQASQVELAEVSGSEHHVTLDNPSGCVAAVSAFLAKTA